MQLTCLLNNRTADDKEGFKNALKYALKIGYRHIDGGNQIKAFFCFVKTIKNSN